MTDFKNIRQIGSPAEADKIYIADGAYQRIHKEDFSERNVFVLMGHTECAPAGYATFVEDVIPVWNITFLQGVPVWTNRVWNEIYKEVKSNYESAVIIGWALDVKGMPPRMTRELEAVHKEHFGGAHQVLFLLDSIEQEEYFYQSRMGYLHRREGFYIYYDGAGGNVIPESIWNTKMRQREQAEQEAAEDGKTPVLEERQPEGGPAEPPRARYRDILYQEQENRQEDSGKWFSSVAVVAAVLLLLAIIGTGIRQGRFSVGGLGQAVETIGTKVLPQEDSSEEDIPTMLRDMETALPQDDITVEEIPGGDF